MKVRQLMEFIRREMETVMPRKRAAALEQTASDVRNVATAVSILAQALAITSVGEAEVDWDALDMPEEE